MKVIVAAVVVVWVARAALFARDRRRMFAQVNAALGRDHERRR